MDKLFFFSGNQNKIKEINNLFKHSSVEIITLKTSLKLSSPKETGLTFAENAKIKSSYGFKKINLPCIGDDSGICIKALNDKPGTRSKRFLNKFKNDTSAFDYIIDKINSSKNNLAYFETSICLTLQSNYHIIFRGKIDGIISNKPRGKNGFGYDPIFIPNGFNKTFAEMSSVQKNKVSHRALAIIKLKNFLIN